MEANVNGVAFTKAELRALREFSSKEPTDRDRFGVQVEIRGDRVFARATNSRICLQLDGESDGEQPDGEWFVDQKFLIDGRKELEGKQVLRLNFTGASLHEATVEENGVTRLTIQNESDAAIAQVSFPQVSKTLKMPPSRRDKVHCVALGAGYLRAVQLAADAVEEDLVEVFPPSTPDGLVVFRAGTDRKTSLMGGILANVTEEAIRNEDDEDSDDDDAPKRSRRKKNAKQGELPGTEDAEAAN